MGLFLRTSIPFIWRILSAFLPTWTPWLRGPVSPRPEVVVVVTPAKYMHDTIMACTKAPSVKAIQCDKPLGAVLSEADEAVAACEASGIVFAGGNLQVAITQLQEAGSNK